MDQTIYLLTCKGFPRPGRSKVAILNDEEYLVANLTDKTDYALAEIYKFNPCLCIISSSAGIIFFLTVFLTKLVKIENIATRAFSIQLVILLPFENRLFV